MLSLVIPGLMRSYQLRNQVPPAAGAAAAGWAANGAPTTNRTATASRRSSWPRRMALISPPIVQVADPASNRLRAGQHLVEGLVVLDALRCDHGPRCVDGHRAVDDSAPKPEVPLGTGIEAERNDDIRQRDGPGHRRRARVEDVDVVRDNPRAERVVPVDPGCGGGGGGGPASRLVERKATPDALGYTHPLHGGQPEGK